MLMIFHLAIVAGFRDFAAGLQTGIRRAQRVLSFQGRQV